MAFASEPLNHIHQDTKPSRLIAVCKRSLKMVVLSYVYTLRLIEPIYWCIYTYEGNKMHSWENGTTSVAEPLNHIHQDTKSGRLIAVCNRSFRRFADRCCKFSSKISGWYDYSVHHRVHVRFIIVFMLVVYHCVHVRCIIVFGFGVPSYLRIYVIQYIIVFTFGASSYLGSVYHRVHVRCIIVFT